MPQTQILILICIWMYVGIRRYICMYVCAYVRMCVYVYIYMCVCVCVCVCVYIPISKFIPSELIRTYLSLFSLEQSTLPDV